MMSTAIPEEIAQECEDQVDIHDNSEERLTELACRLINEANSLTDGPLLNKVMALDILYRLIDWHTKIGTELMKKGEDQGASVGRVMQASLQQQFFWPMSVSAPMTSLLTFNQ